MMGMPTSGCNDATREVMGATSPQDLFGPNEKRARIRYHRLAAAIHPDVSDNPDAESALKHLNGLWAEYQGKQVGRHKPTEIARGERYAVFDEHGKMLVVERDAGGIIQNVKKNGLGKLFLGTPVCMLEDMSAKRIKQGDGNHAAHVCKVPSCLSGESRLMMLDSMAERLPGGRLHPRDLAWISKRMLFLMAALEHECLTICGDPAMSLAVGPDTHMLVVMAPWDLERSESGRADLSKSACDTLTPVIGNDGESRRIGRFLKGVAIDRFTPPRMILDEYDDLLFELFGPPEFHVMETV